jgi:hypothetical protein
MLLLSIASHAQKTIETWYDENWVESPHPQIARYYSHLDNTDSGWYRKDMYVSTQKWQMVGLYADKACTERNGDFRFFYPDGNLKSFGAFDHNKKKGLHVEFFHDGTLKDSAVYKDGHPSGVSSGWYRNGNPEYTFTVDENGNGVYTSWFDNGQPSAAGRYKNFNQRNGRWQFFHKNGKVSGVELYDMGVIKASQYFDENGSPEEDTSKISQPAMFPGGKKAWSKFIDANIYFPSNLDFKNGYRVVLMVSATISEEGKLTDIEVDLPLHPQMDKIAIDALKKSPAWVPAREHNRKVASKFTQTVSFERSYY